MSLRIEGYSEAEGLRDALSQTVDTWFLSSARSALERNEFCSFFRAQNDRAARIRRDKLRSITDRESAADFVRQTQRCLADLMGDLPGPLRQTPFSRQISVTARSSCVIECVLIESLPGYYLPANVYRPVGYSGRLPGLLFLGETSPDGKSDSHCLSFCIEAAQNGFCVLTFDPIGQGERKMLDSNRVAGLDGSPESIRRHIGLQLYPLGQSLCPYMLYDDLRALDYLLSRADVDPKRTGVAGQSDGGIAAAFLGAFDDRLAAVAPSCCMTGLSALACGAGVWETERIPPGFYSAPLDLADLVSAAAPKPYLVSGALFDTVPVDGLRSAALEALRVYAFLDAADRLQVYCSPKPRGLWADIRWTVIGFFCQVLQGEAPRAAVAGAADIPSREELYAARGDVGTVNRVSFLQVSGHRPVRAPEALTGDAALASASVALGLPNQVDCPCEETGPGQFIIHPEPDMTIYASMTGEPVGGHVTVFTGVPADLPKDLTGAALCLEPRGTGRAPWSPGGPGLDGGSRHRDALSVAARNAVLLGRSLLGMTALDIASGVALARRLEGRTVTLLAAGAMSLPSLFASICAPPDNLILTGLLPTFRDVTHETDYTAADSEIAPGIGLRFDVVDILAALRARGLKVTLL